MEKKANEPKAVAPKAVAPKAVTPKITTRAATPKAAPKAKTASVAEQAKGISGVTLVGKSQTVTVPKAVTRTAAQGRVTRSKSTSSINRTTRPVRASHQINRSNTEKAKAARRADAPRSTKVHRVNYETRDSFGNLVGSRKAAYETQKAPKKNRTARSRENIHTAVGWVQEAAPAAGVYK